MSEYIVQHLKSIIIHSLDNDLLKNAEFACERLLAHDSTNLDAVYLYGLTLYKSCKYQTSYNITANQYHVGCSFVFGKACLALDQPNEGIHQLQRTASLWQEDESKFNHSYEFERSLTPDAASIYSLLGDLYKLVGDIKNASINYSSSLKLNHFNFQALEELAKLGSNVKVKAIYKPQFPITNENFINQNNSILNPFAVINNITPILNKSLLGGSGDDSFVSVTNNIKSNQNQQHKSSHLSHNITNSYQNEISNSTSISTPRLKQSTAPDAPIRKSGRVNNEITKQNYSTSSLNNSNSQQNTSTNGSDSISRKNNRLPYSKITSRLISQPSTSTNNSANASSSSSNQNNANMKSSVSATNKRESLKRNKTATNSTDNTSISNSTTTTSTNTSKSASLSKREMEQGELYLLSLYTVFAKAYKALCRYDSFKAIRILESLPASEKNTPWVLGKLGKLHFEIVNYKEAEQFFIRLRELDRTRLEDMEYYSTLLWHLQKKVELSHLAHDLYDINAESCITWCAIGNLFSLNREPDEAIKCFQKAIKLDKKFTYAYTLQGHEYVSNDSYENALESFRNSLLIDPRHYNSLYGIGMVYLKLGDLLRAEYHFRRAVAINPVNVILICCVGMVLEKIGKKSLALKQYELAYKLQPLSALPLFKKAQLLFSLQEYSQSLKDFEKLKNIAPDEAAVHFLLGQLYKIEGDRDKAIKEFTIALHLDPKGSHLIKEAMESLNE